MSRSLYARLHRRFGPRQSSAVRADRLEAHLQAKGPQLPGAGFAQRPASPPPAGRPRAIVVGGGFGGMMAAATLCEAYEVTVLEARDRVGGRVWTLAGAEGRLIEGGGADRLQPPPVDHPGAPVRPRPVGPDRRRRRRLYGPQPADDARRP